MNTYNIGDKMDDLDVYLKSRHDFVNQFQLLYTYKQLGKESKVNSLIDELYQELKQEQLFLNAPCRKFVQEVFSHKISLSGSKWTFEIECNSDEDYQRNLFLSDNILLNIYHKWMNHIVNEIDDLDTHIGLIIEQEFVTLIMSAKGITINENEIKQNFSNYNIEIISYNQEICELEFFININELEV